MEAIRILSIENETHNVVHVRTEKPMGIIYSPGQAADVTVDMPKFENKLRAFTFTSLPSDPFLEFFIKQYPDHHGVTEQIGQLKVGDSLLIGDVFGDIKYQGEGVFIAGGAGITPFISVLKYLDKNDNIGNNKLIFANNTSKDIIANEYFSKLLGENFINVLSQEEHEKYQHGFITKELIQSHIQNEETKFYLCGPPPMMEAVLGHLKDLGIDESRIVKETF